ncbi:ATP synthase F1 subunit delta [Chitinophaga horti]|uniref:ATP synthase subunit delta n=1 Tax=Chitinophaga horti TaxID=2920382 RepID=A0ABY6J3Q5_9BACT|nr:ATP synthase F1 subunit delta [Chitinophaga horti]UYQ93262.1 ATP synthase F1 subunit delta [Chitinophaga horti]
MQNPRLASRYAKAVVDLAVEKNELEAVHTDMQLLKAIFKSNPDVVALLKSPIIKADKKVKILGAVLEGKISAITAGFVKLITEKSRESALPQVAEEVIKQYNVIKNITTVKITTAVPVATETLDAIRLKAEQTAGRKVTMESAVNPELIGGFVLETGDQLFDASVQRDLKDIKKQFLSNIYVSDIR